MGAPAPSAPKDTSQSLSIAPLPLALRLWQGLTKLLGWYLPIMLWHRRRLGLEDPQRKQERFGRATQKRPHGQLIWIQAVSVGETMSVLRLAEQLADKAQNRYVLFTTNTLTSANILARIENPAIMHQFNPLDHPTIVARFLQYWSPDLAIFVESELWPNLLHTLRIKQIPHILLNARLSLHSFRRWWFARSLFIYLLSGFRMIAPQDEIAESRLRKLGGQHIPIQRLGNLKLDAPPLSCDTKVFDQLKAHIDNRSVWLAASTHPGEEEPMAAAHFFARNHYPNLLTIMVPRHPANGNKIAEQLGAMGLNVAQRSKAQTITPTTQIYLADTIGELGIFYRLCDLVFMGGSLLPGIGGQNPMEPARLNCAILHGSHVENFSTIYAALTKSKAALRIDNASDLGSSIGYLLANSGEGRRTREAQARAAKKFARRHTDITANHKDIILNHLA